MSTRIVRLNTQCPSAYDARGSRIVMVVLALTHSAVLADDGVWSGADETRSRITVVNLDGSAPKVVLDSPHRYAAPEWTPHGRDLIVNGGGKLCRLPASGGTPRLIPTGPAPWIDINHAVSPDGKSLVFTAGGSLWKMPAAGGEPTSLISGAGNYVHGWSADGKWLLFSSNRGHGTDLFRISADGGSEVKLTTSPRLDDVGQYSPDGRWIYFLSDRGGTRDLWRMPVSRSRADESQAEQITDDDREDAAPHPSPTANGSSICRILRAPVSTPSTATSSSAGFQSPAIGPHAARRPISPESSAATARWARARFRRMAGDWSMRASSRLHRRSASSSSHHPIVRFPRVFLVASHKSPTRPSGSFSAR